MGFDLNCIGRLAHVRKRLDATARLYNMSQLVSDELLRRILVHKRYLTPKSGALSLNRCQPCLCCFVSNKGLYMRKVGGKCSLHFLLVRHRAWRAGGRRLERFHGRLCLDLILVGLCRYRHDPKLGENLLGGVNSIGPF